MSYKIVPSQIHAADYLNNLSLDFHIHMGGHSKGGNLAIYALSKANDNIKEKIIKVYNFDRPGLVEN